MFKIKRILGSTCMTAVFGMSLLAAPLPQTKEPDNTATNKQPGKTADDQKETAQDRKLSQLIRKSLTKDKGISTYGHNVKIISMNGAVTLRGPVRSEDEKAAIESKAKAVAGVSSVMNELTVAPK